MRTASTPLHHLHCRREYRRQNRRDRGTRDRQHSPRQRAGACPAERQIRPADGRRDWQPAAQSRFLQGGLRGVVWGALRHVPV